VGADQRLCLLDDGFAPEAVVSVVAIVGASST
jgi:hypothetical protein